MEEIPLMGRWHFKIWWEVHHQPLVNMKSCNHESSECDECDLSKKQMVSSSQFGLQFGLQIGLHIVPGDPISAALTSPS